MAHSYRFIAGLALLILCRVSSPNLFGAETAPPANSVLPIRLPEQNDPQIQAMQKRIYRISELQAHYVLSLVHPWNSHADMKLVTESKSSEHFVRPNTTMLQGLAILYRFGPYDEKVMGVSRKDLLKKTIIPMIRYVATTHVTGTLPTSDGKKWGNDWQSAFWAEQFGRAVWIVWDDLPDDLRQATRKIVAYEADRFVNENPPFQTHGDTKAEENAWNSMIFDVAVNLMPTDPRASAWKKAHQRWVMGSYIRPADKNVSTLIDGIPVSNQFIGANINDDFTVENHDRVHPDYMSSINLLIECAMDYPMSGRPVPQSLLYNGREIYDDLKWFELVGGAGLYPSGEDWEVLAVIADNCEIHTEMAVFAHDPDAWTFLNDCLTTAEKMQAHDPKGPVQIKDEFFYEGLQESVLDEFSREWVILQEADKIVNQPVPLFGVKYFKDGEVIVHRTKTAVSSVSWGDVIMAQVVPLQLDRVVSPDDRDGVGQVRLVNQKQPEVVELHSVQVKEDADGYTVDLSVDHGTAVRAELRFQSNPDGTFLMKEKLTALRDCTTSEIATGLIGILNDPKWVYETHHRLVSFDDRKLEVPSLSGKTIESQGVRKIRVDNFEIDAAAPLHAAYIGTKKNEGGRATDELYLNYLNGKRNWKSGQTISTYEATGTPKSQQN